MIKQTWEVSSEEIKRILNLHETATKNHYLIKEQVKQIKVLPPKEFKLPSQTFKPGYHSVNSLSDQQKKDITNVLSEIAMYLKEKSGIPMEIQITAGESQPTNYDNEKTPKTKLASGKLAELRGQTITKILQDFFNGLVQKGELPQMPKIPPFKTKIGKTSKGFDINDQRYKDEQFIRFSVIATGQETTECLVGLKIIFVYFNEPSTDPLLKGCRGGHNCDDAIFDVYLNKTKIGVANLNNKGCEGNTCDKRSEIIVTPEMVNQIVNSEEFKKDQQLTLWYSAVKTPGNPHSSIPEIYIVDKKGERLFPNNTFKSPCVATGAQKGDLGPWALMTLDGCGVPLNVNRELSTKKTLQYRSDVDTEEANRIKNSEAKTKKEREDQLTAQSAKQKQYLEYGTTEGFELIPGRNNANYWNSDSIKLSDQKVVENFYVVTVNSTKAIPLRYIKDPITPGNNKLDIPKNVNFIIKYPLSVLNFPLNQRKFEKEYQYFFQNIGGGYYFVMAAPELDGKNRKDLLGTVIKPNFK